MKILNSSLSQDLTPPLSQGEGEKKLSKLQIVSIAKKEEELFITHPPTPSLHMNGRRKNEYTFKKIILEKDSMELRLIQKIRDEAHRFAITFNRDSRIKSMKKNILESIP
jgi:excinuclease ABC subunit C